MPTNKNSKIPIAIFGAGGLGKEVKIIIDAINKVKATYQFIGYFDDNQQGENIIGDLNVLNGWKDELHIVVAVGSPVTKQKIIGAIQNQQVKYATLIHPRVIIGDKEKVAIGVGTILTAGSILTTDIKIGNHVLINLNATIGHDVLISDFCSIMPGVNIAGAVKLEPCVLIGSGANIINEARIGSAASVGAGAVVTKDIKTSTTVVGVPAREMRT